MTDTLNIDGLKVGPCMVRGYIERIAELEDQNMRLRLALLELKERYSCSPWIHRQVDEAIRKEIT